MSDPANVVKRIQERGYRTVRVRPETYVPDPKIKLSDLEKAVQSSAVSLRGWDFPHVDNQSQPRRDNDFVEQAIDWSHFAELWRAYRSRQFYSIAGLLDDWRDKEPVMFAPPDDWRPCTRLGVEDTVFRFTEIFEFAARWSIAMKIEGNVVIGIEVVRLEGRSLVLGPNRAGFFSPKTAHLPSWKASESFSTAEVVAKPRELAIPLLIDFFEKFNWDVNPEAIKEIQGELRRR